MEQWTISFVHGEQHEAQRPSRWREMEDETVKDEVKNQLLQWFTRDPSLSPDEGEYMEV